jgi:hypothetical protein
MNSADIQVFNNGPTRASLFPFPPHHDTAGDVCKYLRYPALVSAEVNDSLGPRSGRDGFVCDNVPRLLTYRAGVMVGAIEVEAVQVDIVDTDSE